MIVFAWVLLVLSVLVVLSAFANIRANTKDIGSKMMVFAISPYVIFLVAFLIMGYGA